MTKEEFNVSIAHEFIDFRDEIVQWKDEEEIFEMAEDIFTMKFIKEFLINGKMEEAESLLISYQNKYPRLLQHLFEYEKKKRIIGYLFGEESCNKLIRTFFDDPKTVSLMNDYVFSAGLYRYLEKDESVFRYVIEGNQFPNGCIMPKGGSDISAGLEDTLHRILDNGGNAEDIREILGAVPFEELQTMGVNEESCISIDLGYYLPGTIFSA